MTKPYVTEMTNFCRVFELPENYPSDFCFGRGIPVTMQMVDWFNPISPAEVTRGQVKPWSENVSKLRDWLSTKVYVQAGRKYLLITDFGESFIFEKGISQPSGNTVIAYESDGLILKTPCPYSPDNVIGVKVGSLSCQKCMSNVHTDKDSRVVECSFKAGMTNKEK